MMNYTLMKLNPQLNDFQIYIQRQRRGIKTNVNRRAEMALQLILHISWKLLIQKGF